MPRDRGIARYGSLRSTMARYASSMERRCDYCLIRYESVTIVSAVERMSGPPFILVACAGCMKLNGLKPWQR
jgi:hypothetical protein